MLARTLSFLDGEYLLRWSKRHDGGLPSAALIFTSEAIARRALENLGGGTRGLFRVTQPAWAARGGSRNLSTLMRAPSTRATHPPGLGGHEDTAEAVAGPDPVASADAVLATDLSAADAPPKWRSSSAVAAQQLAAAEREAQLQARRASHAARCHADAIPPEAPEPVDPVDADLVEQLGAMGFSQRRCVWAARVAKEGGPEQRLAAATELLLQPVDPASEFVERQHTGRAVAVGGRAAESRQNASSLRGKKTQPPKVAQPQAVRVANPWDLLGDDD